MIAQSGTENKGFPYAIINPSFVGLQRAEFEEDFPYGLYRALHSNATEIDAKRRSLGDTTQLVRALAAAIGSWYCAHAKSEVQTLSS
jgi:hypothetical protein